MTAQIDGHQPTSLAERFWSLARAQQEHSSDPVDVVRHVLAILDALDAGETGADLTVNTVSFLHLLRQSEAKGDMQYASPEQARGEMVDERSLVFSAGVLIFEKLTGRHPFGAEANPTRMARIRRAEMASGVSYFQTISGPLRTILLRCMGPFPQDRWNTLAELRRELEAFVAGDNPGGQRFSLPALPVSPESESSAPIVKRRFARASSRALTVAAERESKRRDNSMADQPETASASWLGRAAWMLVGGAAASAFFLLALPGADETGLSSAATTPASGAAKMAPPPVVSAKGAAPSGAARAPASAPKPEATPAVALEEAAPDEAQPVAAQASVSPESIGESALVAARDCFSDERLSEGLEFGVSMLLAPGRESARVYFGRATLAGNERACLKDMLVGLPLGKAPAQPTTLSYSFFIDGNSGRVRTRVKE